MRIKFLSGPNAGKLGHAERSQATQLLIDSGVIEVVAGQAPRRGSTEWLEERLAADRAMNPARPDPVVTWGIKNGYFSRRPAITASCSNANCAINFRFEGPAFKVDGKNKIPLSLDSVVFVHSCGHPFPETVSAQVVVEYRKAYAEGVFELPPDEAAMLSQAATGRKSSVSDKTRAWLETGFLAPVISPKKG
jgi:hypothetical protein